MEPPQAPGSLTVILRRTSLPSNPRLGLRHPSLKPLLRRRRLGHRHWPLLGPRLLPRTSKGRLLLPASAGEYRSRTSQPAAPPRFSSPPKVLFLSRPDKSLRHSPLRKDFNGQRALRDRRYRRFRNLYNHSALVS